MTRADRVKAYARSFEGVPVTWGVDDCSMFVARWVERETGLPLPLPSYGSRDEAHTLIAEAGSLAALWGNLAAEVGIHETGAPELGDVGVIDTSRFGQVGVIWLANGACYWRESKGVTLFQPRCYVKAWRVPELVA